jgi:hypothetical protein
MSAYIAGALLTTTIGVLWLNLPVVIAMSCGLFGAVFARLIRKTWDMSR